MWSVSLGEDGQYHVFCDSVLELTRLEATYPDLAFALKYGFREWHEAHELRQRIERALGYGASEE